MYDERVGKKGGLTGVVSGQVIEVRLAFSGKVAKVLKRPGDKVRAGEMLVTLDGKELQAMLDKELADYERVRAEFELWVMDHPNPANDREKQEKVQVQALLNAAVKAVELAKWRLDETELRSPITGTVIADGGLRPGLFATPAANAFEIIDEATLCLEVEISWEEIHQLPTGQAVKVKIAGQEAEIEGKVWPMVPTLKGRPKIRVGLAATEGIWPGMTGEIRV